MDAVRGALARPLIFAIALAAASFTIPGKPEPRCEAIANAHAQTRDARASAAHAELELERMQRELEALDQRIQQALSPEHGCPSSAERGRARATLARLQAEQARASELLERRQRHRRR